MKKYRFEIDGLRAIAVIPVVLYHAGLNNFEGGFIGVDIFFVISGYLISSIIIKGLEQNSFSLKSFYVKRARRLLPVLLLLVILSIPFARIWLFPDQYETFRNSIYAVLLFVPNFFFKNITGGYFGINPDEIPFLHTWSLGIEEQFYLFLPLVLIASFKLNKNYIPYLLLTLFIVSFGVSEWGWRNRPDGSFFHPATRAWELLSGCLIPFIFNKKLDRNIESTLSVLGLCLITISFFVFRLNIPHPSYYTLIPVVGTMLVIRFTNKESVTGKFLTISALRYIGLISYSLYLWHYPIFVFARARMIDEPTNLFVLIFIIASVLLSILSYHFIEKPFRNNTIINNYVFSFTIISALLSISLYTNIESGAKITPYGESEKDYLDYSDCTFNDTMLLLDEAIDDCLGIDNNFILIGDSHARHFSKSLRSDIERKGGNLLSINRSGFLPFLSMHRDGADDWEKEGLGELLSQTDATIIYLIRWRLYSQGTRFNNNEGGIEGGNKVVVYDSTKSTTLSENEIINNFKKILVNQEKKRNLVLITQIPESGWNSNYRAAKMIKFSDNDNPSVTTSYQVFNAANHNLNNLFKELDQHKSINVYHPAQLVCNTVIFDRCLNVHDNHHYYHDDDHASIYFNKILSEHVTKGLLFNE